MKRGKFLKRKTPWTNKFAFGPQAALKAHSKLRVVGHSDVAETKRNIQALLRSIVMLRDKGCILRDVRCHNTLDTPGIVFQAEHLVERSNGATYADSRLVVCVCKNCHGWKHFKDSNKEQYDALVRACISPERVALWDRCKADIYKPKRVGSYDWKLCEIALQKELDDMLKA